MTVTAGVARADADHHTAEPLIAAAERSLYAAKIAGCTPPGRAALDSE